MEKEPTSLSTNPLQNDEDAPLNENLPKSKTETTWLSDIPLLHSSPSQIKQPQLPKQDIPPTNLFSSEPSLCENEDAKFEYEFSLCFDGCLCFVHLYDSSDVSACERVLHRPVTTEEITYSPTTGNAFVTDGPFKYTFTKQPYQRTWTTHADIKAGVEYENTVGKTKKKHVSAEDILSSL